jgi:hypothetical protein
MAHSYFAPSVLLVGLVFVAGCSSNSTETTSVATKPKAEASRKTVKTASDPDAGSIVATPKDTTIEEILAQKVPEGDLTGRSGDFEKQTWRVKATLKSVELKKDGDYYLVMNGEKGGQTVVEVPDPKLCQDSRFKDEITATRKALEEKYHPTKTPQLINDPATVTGVGFLGWGKKAKKGAKGHSGPRLMPGTGIEFGG